MSWMDWIPGFGIPGVGNLTDLKKSDWLGGAAASTNPADYQTPYQDRDEIQQQIRNGMAGVQGRPAPTIDPAFRNAQLAQMNQLQGIASGSQAGAGELAVNRQVQSALGAQQAQARMARGGNAALAARNAARGVGQVGLAGAGQASQAQMQDQMNAQGLLSGVTSQGRAGDLGVGQMQQQQMQQNDAANLGYLQQYGNMNANQLQAQIAAMNAATGKPGLLGPILSAGGQAAAAGFMSDERVKEDIEDGDEDVDAMLDALRAKRYKYKDPKKHGEGERLGIIAQDLNKSRAGSAVTVDTPDGIGVDIGKAVSAALAGLARVNKRLRDVEGKR